MATYTTPISTAFELQRATIKQSQQAVEQSLAFQQNLNQAFLNSFESGGAAGERGAELSKSMVDAYFDAVEAAVPGAGSAVAEVRQVVDEQFELFQENQVEAFDTIGGEFEKGIDAFDDISADFVEAFGEQLELFLEAHEQIEEGTVDAFSRAAEQVEQVQEQAAEQLEA